jgi:hypothetical protein
VVSLFFTNTKIRNTKRKAPAVIKILFGSPENTASP